MITLATLSGFLGTLWFVLLVAAGSFVAGAVIGAPIAKKLFKSK